MLASLYHAVFYQKKQIIQIHVDGKIYGMICLICYHFYNIWKHTKCWHLLWIPYSIKYAYSSELQTQENGYSGKGGRGKLQWPPLQYSGLETPMDGGAWWAAVHGVVRIGHDWATSLSLFTFMHWRRKWQPFPVFLPGESQGRGSLVGCRLSGRTKSDTTEAT